MSAKPSLRAPRVGFAVTTTPRGRPVKQSVAHKPSTLQVASSPPKRSTSLREAIALKRAEARKLQSSRDSSVFNDPDSTAFDDPNLPTKQPGKASSDDDVLDLGRLSVRETIERARKTGTLNLATRSLVCIPSALFEIHLGIKPNPLRTDEPALSPSTELSAKHGSKIENQPSWFEAQDLCVLKVWGNEIEEIQHEISLFGSLKTVDLHKNRIASLPSSFADLTALTVLDLSSNALTELPTNLFALPNLATLNVSNNCLTSLPFGSPFTEEVMRKSRYPTGTSLFTPAITRSTTPLPHLVTFDASHNKISAQSVDSASLPVALIRFDLSSNPLRGPGCVELILALSRLERLKMLRFEKCDIGHEDFPSLPEQTDQLIPFRSLQVLDLGETKVAQEVIKPVLAGLKQKLSFEITTDDPPPGELRVIVGKKVIREPWEIEAERKARMKARDLRNAEEENENEDQFEDSGFGFDSVRQKTDDAFPSIGSASSGTSQDAVEMPVKRGSDANRPKPKEVVKEAWELEAEQGLLTEGGKRRARAAAAAARAQAETVASGAPNEGTSITSGQKKEVIKEQWEIDAEQGLLTEGGKRRARAAAAASSTNAQTRNGSKPAGLGLGKPSPLNETARSTVGVSLSSPQYYNQLNETLTLPPSTPPPKNQVHARAFSLASSPTNTNVSSSKSLLDMALPIPTLPLAAISTYPFCDTLKVLILANRRMDKTFSLPALFEGAAGDSSIHLPNLEELSLEGCMLGDQVTVTRQTEGTATPPRTTELLIPLLTKLFPSLRTLDLSYNALTSASLTAPLLSSLVLRAPHRRGLRHLRLRGNKLSDLDGLVAITEMFKGNRDVPAWGVEELDLRDNEIGKLPAELGLLPLDVFLVDGNTFRVPQRRVWERDGTKGLLAWLKSRIEY